MQEALRAPVAGSDFGPRSPSRYRKRLASGSLAARRPDLAAQWHPTANGTVTPNDVTSSSNYQNYWWLCSRCGYAWQASPNNRARGQDCPACSNRVVTPTNSLAAVVPGIAAQWDYEANGELTPYDVTPGSGRLVGWICREGHRYPAPVFSRNDPARGCPVCRGLAVIVGVNDLATTRPDVAALWHPTANGTLKPEHVTASSGIEVVWLCTKHRFTWSAAVMTRTRVTICCPVAAGQQVVAGVNDLATLRPDVAAYWVSCTSGLGPTEVTIGSGRIAVWRCTNSLPHVFPRQIAARVRNANCPVCSNHRLLPGFNDLATRHPLLASEWHTGLNGKSASAVLPGDRVWWWRCHRGHLLQSTVSNRIGTRGCSSCPPGDRLLN